MVYVNVSLLNSLLPLSELHLRKNSRLIILFFFVESQVGSLPFNESKLILKVSIYLGSDRELDTARSGWSSCLSFYNLVLRRLITVWDGCAISPLYLVVPESCSLCSRTICLDECFPLLFVLVQVIFGIVSRCQE